MMNNATLAIRWVGRRLGFGKPETISAPTATKRLVGSPACDAIYRIAHNWAYERFVNRMAVMTGDDDITCLELCGTWRITRIRLHPGYHWSFHQWHPVKQEWFSIDCQKLPEIRLIGRGAQRANLAKALISHACRWYCEVAAQTCRPALLALTQLRKPKTIEETISWAEQILSEDRMRHKQRYEPLDAAGGMAAAALWKLLDPDHVRAACQIFMGGGPTFAQYIAIQSEFEAIKKVRAEHPNFLPLLRVIPSRLWADHNLFAQYRWGSIETTPLQRQTARLADSTLAKYTTTLASKRAWRKFVSTPAPVIDSLVHKATAGAFQDFFEVLALTREPAASIWQVRMANAFCSRAFRFQLNEQDAVLLARICDCFFAQARALRNADGWKASLGALTADMLGDVLDWWHHDGRGRRLPAAQATWTSVRRLSQQWERRYDEHGPSEADKHLRWESLIGATVIDGVEILPLDTAGKLAEEGEALHHCVGTYARICYSSAQRIFSLRAGELRSTLRLALDGDTWRIAEHRSFCNDLAPEPFRKVAEKVAMAYTVAERAGAATATKAPELLTNGEL
jgi:hypothetical protein